MVKAVIEKDTNFHFDANRADGEVLHLSVILPAQLSPNASILVAASLEKDNDETKSAAKAFADIQVEQGRISGNDVSASVTQALQNLYQLRAGKAVDTSGYLAKVETAARGEEVPMGVLINAITVLTEMREQKAAPAIIDLLNKTDNPALGNACVVALGELHAADGMSAIINFVERKPPIFRRQAVEAARKIGTKEAAEWLLVMAYGYDDPQVREQAKLALVEVEEKLGIAQ